jgi:hypothetical protein
LPHQAPFVLTGDGYNDAQVLNDRGGQLIGDYEVQKQLLPVPFFGNPEKAEVYVLVSNPGYDPERNDREHSDPSFRQRYRASLGHDMLHPYLDRNFECVAGGGEAGSSGGASAWAICSASSGTTNMMRWRPG